MRTHLKLVAISAAAALALPALAEEEKLAFLGVGTNTIHPTLAAQLELDEGAGLAVRSVVEESPASMAGIVEHDILAAFDGTALTSPAQLRELVMTRNPGDEVEIILIRKAKEETVKVTLGELPDKFVGGEPRPGDDRRMPGFGPGGPGLVDVD